MNKTSEELLAEVKKLNERIDDVDRRIKDTRSNLYEENDVPIGKYLILVIVIFIIVSIIL